MMETRRRDWKKFRTPWAEAGADAGRLLWTENGTGNGTENGAGLDASRDSTPVVELCLVIFCRCCLYSHSWLQILTAPALNPD
jgi:hypothetical protein